MILSTNLLYMEICLIKIQYIYIRYLLFHLPYFNEKFQFTKICFNTNSGIINSLKKVYFSHISYTYTRNFML